MIALLRNTSSRFTIALVLAVMVHVGIMWLPYLHFPHQKVNLPPLSVRLESLPVPDSKPVAKLPPQNPISTSGKGSFSKSKPSPTNPMKELEKTTAPLQFPKQLHISFNIFSGSQHSKTGVLQHELDIDADRYILKSVRQEYGLAGLKNKIQLIQISSGKIVEHGLLPALYEEEKTSESGKQNLKATFDWPAHQLHYSQGNDSALPDGAQDSLSYWYQLSLLSISSMGLEFFQLPISDATQIQLQQIEIGIKEEIQTSMGKLQTLHLRKMHSQGEPYFEIWLGLEYRMLPVKFRQVDGAEKVIEEYEVSDIRATDEP